MYIMNLLQVFLYIKRRKKNDKDRVEYLKYPIRYENQDVLILKYLHQFCDISIPDQV